jgi:hypothetical protein
MVPLFAGVIIAGLGIGALLSAFAARHVPAPVQHSTPLAVMQTQTPAPAASIAQATATPRRTAAPKVTATATASAKPTVKPALTSTPTSRPTATPTDMRTPKASPAPTTTPPAPSATPTVRPTLAVRTPPPTVPPTAAPVAVQGSPAEALVRKFLEAVAHGDDTTAYGTLAGTSTPLGEAQFLDPTMRITSMTSGHGPGGGTNVQVEFRTSRGEYFGTFTVDSSGSKITQREVIPVGGTTAR